MTTKPGLVKSFSQEDLLNSNEKKAENPLANYRGKTFTVLQNEEGISPVFLSWITNKFHQLLGKISLEEFKMGLKLKGKEGLKIECPNFDALNQCFNNFTTYVTLSVINQISKNSPKRLNGILTLISECLNTKNYLGLQALVNGFNFYKIYEWMEKNKKFLDTSSQKVWNFCNTELYRKVENPRRIKDLTNEEKREIKTFLEIKKYPLWEKQPVSTIPIALFQNGLEKIITQLETTATLLKKTAEDDKKVKSLEFEKELLDYIELLLKKSKGNKTALSEVKSLESIEKELLEHTKVLLKKSEDNKTLLSSVKDLESIEKELLDYIETFLKSSSQKKVENIEQKNLEGIADLIQSFQDWSEYSKNFTSNELTNCYLDVWGRVIGSQPAKVVSPPPSKRSSYKYENNKSDEKPKSTEKPKVETRHRRNSSAPETL
ncbi:MAG: hypothetical protein L0207_06715 [Chlamydiae bacterium]|nr:hypothetical protein [Chlamydiota bacterium]